LKLTPTMARAILDARAKKDPLRHYVPGPTQTRCELSRARYRWIGGPNRAGKSGHAAAELAKAARRMHPTRTVTSKNGLYLILAPSREQLSDPWGKKLLKESELKGACFGFPMIPRHEIEKVYYVHGAGAPTPKEIVLKSGHRIMFLVSGDPNVWQRVQGKGMVLGIVIDEAAGNEQLISECALRLLDANSDPEIRRESGGGWILWGATETSVNLALSEYIGKCENPEYPDFEGFRINPGENPAISQDERDKLRPILGEDQSRIRLDGTGSAMGSLLIFGPHWDSSRHVRTTDYEIREDDNIWIGYDPGTNYTGILLAAISKDNPRKVRVVKCWQPRRMTLDYDVGLIRDYLMGRALECFVYDPAARKVEKTGLSVIGQLSEKLRMARVRMHRGLAMGRNRHEDGIPVVRYYMKPGDRDEPYLEVNPSQASGCGLLINQVMQYRNEESPTTLLGTEHVHKENDHLVDALRYLLCERPGWVNRGPNPPLWGPSNGSPPPQPLSDNRVYSDQELRELERMRLSAIAARRRQNNTKRQLIRRG
jgi:hypothetical protein